MRGRSLVWLLLVLAAALAIGVLYRDADHGPQEEAQTLAVAPGCDPESEICTAGDAGRGLGFAMPEGARLMAAFPVEVQLRGLAADAVTVDFRMQGMDMGVNRAQLQDLGGGRWRGDVILPVCTTGRADWLAVVDVRSAKGGWQAVFPFSVER